MNFPGALTSEGAKSAGGFFEGAYRPLGLKVTRKQAWLALLLVLLNLCDAFFTLRHVANGALELNPLMAELLGRGEARFVIIKHILVCLSLSVILLRWRSQIARVALPSLVIVFSAVVVYHSVLLFLC